MPYWVDVTCPPFNVFSVAELAIRSLIQLSQWGGQEEDLFEEFGDVHANVDW